MRPLLQLASWMALAATLVPSVLYLGGSMPLDTVKTWMLAGTVVWFAATPFWMDRDGA